MGDRRGVFGCVPGQIPIRNTIVRVQNRITVSGCPSRLRRRGRHVGAWMNSTGCVIDLPWTGRECERGRRCGPGWVYKRGRCRRGTSEDSQSANQRPAFKQQHSDGELESNPPNSPSVPLSCTCSSTRSYNGSARPQFPPLLLSATLLPHSGLFSSSLLSSILPLCLPLTVLTSTSSLLPPHVQILPLVRPQSPSQVHTSTLTT